MFTYSPFWDKVVQTAQHFESLGAEPATTGNTKITVEDDQKRAKVFTRPNGLNPDKQVIVIEVFE